MKPLYPHPMRIVVTGAAGFIGSNLTAALLKRGHSVVALDDLSLGKESNLAAVRERITFICGSITDPEVLLKVTSGADRIVNLAAASASPMFSLERVGTAVFTNVQGFMNVLTAAVRNRVKRVLYASTSSVYGNNPPPLTEDMKLDPPNMYAATKLENEFCAKIFSQEFGLETAGFRFLSVYGPQEESKGRYANLASQFLWEALQNQSPIIYGDGEQTRDFTYVKDVVQALILGLESPLPLHGEIFNVGSGTSYSLNELVGFLQKMIGKEVRPQHVPNPVKNYIWSQDADISKIRRVLGYVPAYLLEQGLRDMLPQVRLQEIRKEV